MYKELKDIFNYLVTVRVLKTYLSIDVEFPIGWKIPKKFVQEDKVMEQTSSAPDERLFSFVCEISEESIENTSSNLQNIIKYNLEREEKEKLFENKVNELKEIFDKQNLNNLKNLKFDIKNNKIEFEDNEEEIGTTRLAD